MLSTASICFFMIDKWYHPLGLVSLPGPSVTHKEVVIIYGRGAGGILKIARTRYLPPSIIAHYCLHPNSMSPPLFHCPPAVNNDHSLMPLYPMASPTVKSDWGLKLCTPRLFLIEGICIGVPIAV